MKQVANIKSFNTFPEMLAALPNDTACREYLESKVWHNGTPTCPHCGVVDESHYRLTAKGEFKGMYKCKSCKQRFNVLAGTMFEGTHIGLQKWFIAIYIFSMHKKGVSSHQLASDLGITQKSSWFMLSRIRNAFKQDLPNKKIDGLFSADETYIGGANKNRHQDKKIDGSQGRSTKDKTPVFGIMQTGGKVRTTVVPNTQAKTLKPIITDLVKEGSIIVTDEWEGYSGLSKSYAHITVKHKEGQYTNGAFSPNNMENFWSLLCRGIYGIYHQVSPKHLNKYCDEFAFRFNARKTSVNNRFNFSLENSTRLPYKKLIGK
jgi:transposase-like protein